jgi:hypothetical protein
MDTGRVGVETVMSDQQDEAKPIGNAVSLAGSSAQLPPALTAERQALLSRYPIKSRRARVTAARNYSSISAAATLTSGCSNVDTTLQVDTVSGFPSCPTSCAWTRTGWGKSWSW